MFSDRVMEPKRGGAFAHAKGPAIFSTKKFLPTSHVYGKILSYRSYILARQSRSHSMRSPTTKRNLTTLKLYLGDIALDGSEPISILDFIAVFVDQADHLQIAEFEALSTLPKMLSGNAASGYRSKRRASRSSAQSI